MTTSPQTPAFLFSILVCPHPQPQHFKGLHYLSGSCSHLSLQSVLVCLGCHTKYHKLGSLKNGNLFSHSPGGWRSKVKVPAVLVSGETTLLGLQTATFSVSSHGHYSVSHIPGVSSSFFFFVIICRYFIEYLKIYKW